MDLKQIFADEDAVSPVIGVILMVAITVILHLPLSLRSCSVWATRHSRRRLRRVSASTSTQLLIRVKGLPMVSQTVLTMVATGN